MDKLDEMDKQLLDSLEYKLQYIRDRVRGVAEGYSNGLYLHGEGGIGKSHTVEETLKLLKKPYKLSNSRITGKGLFDLLRDYPDVIHVIEDAETLFSDKNSFGVLRSALWGQDDHRNKQERLIVWQIGGLRQEIIFTGGIILVANRDLDNIPQLRAVRTRIACPRFQPTTDEVAAKMRQIAKQGHRHGPITLPPDECLEVAAEIITASQRLQRNLDLRLFVNGCKDRIQWKEGAAETHWKVLLEGRMKERTPPPDERYESRNERTMRELEIVRTIMNLPPTERLSVWQRETGKSKAALYRRLEQAG